MIHDCREEGVCLAVGEYRGPLCWPFWLGEKEAETVCNCIEAFSGQSCTDVDQKPMYLTVRGEFITTSSNIHRMMSPPWRRLVDTFYESMGKHNNPTEGHILER